MFSTTGKSCLLVYLSVTNFVFKRAYVDHITRVKGCSQRGYKTLQEARFRYQRAVNLGIVEVLHQ